MLDKYAHPLVQKPLNILAKLLTNTGITANQITLFGFAIGMLCIPLLAFEQYGWALTAIAMNRILDGLDGTLARLQGPTDHGGYLDIVLDFIFYSAVIFGFALANPQQNALASAFLIFSFIGTGCSFLAFAILAQKHKINRVQFSNKSIHYLEGITEGTETIAFYFLICLFPNWFSIAAWLFGGLCWVTTMVRIWGGFHTIRQKAD
ncbi:CDP-alcohol phosphatidyltransferase family protein [Pelagibaculum spongiae]|uniref:CDP-alcohol phosphatidyltransferase family protein n=1 Tax=Pelagibaculum spongiae TaxID=2080658 RepID=A0A2V1H1W0_9GAMM|nr:CDP-alcohol phosphatidyltransferase family protein [Pelagibaculum spongiae]PVZ71950.1 hypothetical protein DC094_02700 [Pelagibaculum spongiae]